MEQIKEAFRIKDLEGASWVLKKLRALSIKQAEIDAVAKKEIDVIQKWQKEETGCIDQDKGYFEGLLEMYYREQRTIDPKFKISTPWGKVSSRKMQPKWEYKNEIEVAKYFKENGFNGLYREKLEIDKNCVKDALKDGEIFLSKGEVVVKDTGEVIPGILVIDQEDSISIKVEV